MREIRDGGSAIAGGILSSVVVSRGGRVVENHLFPLGGAPSAQRVRQEGDGSRWEWATPHRYALSVPWPLWPQQSGSPIPYNPPGRARMRTDPGREGGVPPGLGLEHAPPQDNGSPLPGSWRTPSKSCTDLTMFSPCSCGVRGSVGSEG